MFSPSERSVFSSKKICADCVFIPESRRSVLLANVSKSTTYSITSGSMAKEISLLGYFSHDKFRV